MEDKSLPYNLRLRKDQKASGSAESPKNQKQEKDFQVEEGSEAVDYRCEKCGSSFELEISLNSHQCKKKNEKELTENESSEGLRERVEEKKEKNKSMRKRRRKGIPIRSPLF